jgi:hypothetical protein
MNFLDVLKRCKGQTVIINNSEERVLLEVDEDFLVLQGGNPQMRLTEFVPVGHVVKVIRADYATGDSSTSLDLTGTTGDQRRAH